MSFGERLKRMREDAGWSQEQLGERLCVSRQAITKWETGRGMPDVENLRAIADLFGKSVDELLDREPVGQEPAVVEETVDLTGIEKTGGSRSREDEFVKRRFSGAEQIVPLIRRLKLNRVQWWLDFFIGAGTLEVAELARTGRVSCYLVEQDGVQRLVTLHKNEMVIHRLNAPFAGKKQVIGSYVYARCGYTLR